MKQLDRIALTLYTVSKIRKLIGAGRKTQVHLMAGKFLAFPVDLCIHTGPIVRREEIYEFMSITDRRRIFNKLVAFFRQVDIRYKCISIEKKHADDVIQATSQLSRKMSQFIQEDRR